MNRRDTIFVADHRGMVGSAIVRRLQAEGCEHIVTRTRNELDLTNPFAVRDFFQAEQPDYVFFAAAKPGAVPDNRSSPVDLLQENLNLQGAIIPAAADLGVGKLLFFAGDCVYPISAPQPILESSLLTGPLDQKTEGAGLAQICGMRLCQACSRQYGKAFLPSVVTNLYGPEDSFDNGEATLLPSLIRKVHEAKVSGLPEISVEMNDSTRREFLHVDDLADAAVYLMRHYEGTDIINIGSGEDVSIRHLAELIGEVIGFKGAIRYTSSKASGSPRRLLNVEKLLTLGWMPTISLSAGIAGTYRWYRENYF